MDDIDQGIAMACNLIASHLHSFLLRMKQETSLFTHDTAVKISFHV